MCLLTYQVRTFSKMSEFKPVVVGWLFCFVFVLFVVVVVGFFFGGVFCFIFVFCCCWGFFTKSSKVLFPGY